MSTSETAYIYALCDPDTGAVRYVGKASDPQARLREHLEPNQLRPDTHRTHWLRGLLAVGKAPELRILECVTGRSWQEAEIDWIARFLADGADLTNTTTGGDGGALIRELTPEMRQRMSASHRGRKFSADTRAKMAAAIRASLERPEVRAKMSASRIGKARAPEIRAKISASSRGKIISEEQRAKISAALTGRRVREYGPTPIETRARISHSVRRSFFVKRSRKATDWLVRHSMQLIEAGRIAGETGEEG